MQGIPQGLNDYKEMGILPHKNDVSLLNIFTFVPFQFTKSEGFYCLIIFFMLCLYDKLLISYISGTEMFFALDTF